jgi:MFS family permease
MLPLILGLLVAGPASGWLSDRFGARPFATGGVLVAAASFVLLIVLPVDFGYLWFALILLLNGIGMGLFQSPNTAGVMNSLPPAQRGAGAGMLATFNVSSSVLSIGVFFTLMIVGLASGLPHATQSGLVAHGVSPADATRISHLPPVATLFAAFLGYNPVKTLLGPRVLHRLSPANAQTLTGRGFFPHLISGPFHTALVYAFVFAIAACLVAAFASLLRGGKYVHVDEPVANAVDPLVEEAVA